MKIQIRGIRNLFDENQKMHFVRLPDYSFKLNNTKLDVVPYDKLQAKVLFPMPAKAGVPFARTFS
jgi:hypothetical protein